MRCGEIQNGRPEAPSFVGRWRIIETDVWAEDALDLMVPAHITFGETRLGFFQVIAVDGATDCRFEDNRVDFSWIGDDDGKRTAGRGWALIHEDGLLRGRLYFHQGEESGFVARREQGDPAAAQPQPLRRARAHRLRR